MTQDEQFLRAIHATILKELREFLGTSSDDPIRQRVREYIGLRWYDHMYFGVIRLQDLTHLGLYQMA
nr:MAG TPA: hypothetical protein [Bacteriophage sp.]